ncbi:hypothetical protein WKI68_02565 [Streptomyces sp. MS1.HAVA.3]|uniref:Uncharacterized protein n=1 Tax=Streptomyces caledonius TaxID=3134107 RepID=A0ABU8TZC5_9ACTN
MRQHQRRDDALQQVLKYQALAANAEKHLAELRPMLAYTQSRLENAELQLKLAGERERARVGRQLGQAKQRLSRVRGQQERARNHRMTAEEQQEFWMTEALTAQEEISRLEREAQDLVVPQTTLEPARPDEVDDSDFETRLEHITAGGLEDEALIDEDLQPAPSDSDGDGIRGFLAAQDAVQSVSNSVLDKPDASADVQRQAALASVARALHMAGPARLARLVTELEGVVPSASAEPRLSFGKNVLVYLGLISGPEEPPEVIETWMRILMQAPLLIITVFQYVVAQEVAGRPDVDRWAGVVVGTVMCLPLLYGELRLARMPKLPARILAVLLHAAWSVLLLLDRLPWPAPDFGTQEGRRARAVLEKPLPAVADPPAGQVGKSGREAGGTRGSGCPAGRRALPFGARRAVFLSDASREMRGKNDDRRERKDRAAPGGLPLPSCPPRGELLRPGTGLPAGPA